MYNPETMLPLSKRFIRSFAALSTAFCLSVPVLAAGQANSRASDLPKIEFEKYTLPNRLQVILHVDRKLPMVHVNCWYHVSSKNEKPGRTGFAHLF